VNLKKLTTIVMIATIAVSLFAAPSLWADQNPLETWSGNGSILQGTYEVLGFTPWANWTIEIFTQAGGNPNNIDGTWYDSEGYTGNIYGFINYLGDGSGSGTWDCDQSNKTGTWTGDFGRDGVGDDCSGWWYYGLGGGGFDGTRTD
jgi:hypothetical protein